MSKSANARIAEAGPGETPDHKELKSAPRAANSPPETVEKNSRLVNVRVQWDAIRHGVTDNADNKITPVACTHIPAANTIKKLRHHIRPSEPLPIPRENSESNNEHIILLK